MGFQRWFSSIVSLYYFIFIIWGSYAQPSIDEPPVDVTVLVGGSTMFECGVQNWNRERILWQKSSPNGFYIGRNGDNPFPGIDPMKFRLRMEGGEANQEANFVLEILDVGLDDAGEYSCLYERSSASPLILGSATLSVVEVDPQCSYVTVPSVNEVLVDLNCSWSSDYSDVPAAIYRNGQMISADFQLSDRVISRVKMNQISELNEFECRWISPATGQTHTCRYQQNARAPLNLGVEPYINHVVMGNNAKFNCQAEIYFDQQVSYSWTILKDGRVLDLGSRQKGPAKQVMKILDVELSDDGIMVMCSAQIGNTITQGVGLLAVQPPTSPTQPPSTTKFLTIPNGSSAIPREDSQSISTIVIIVIAVLLFLILILVLVIIVLARARAKHPSWASMGRSLSTRKPRNKGKADAQLTEPYLHGGQEVLYPDPNPDIIRSHSTSLPLYAMPDKLMKSSTMDGCARYPPKHYLPRRQSCGAASSTDIETEFKRQASPSKPSDQCPNPYENIDENAVNEARRFRSKSHTVSRFNNIDSQPPKQAASPRKYRGMKSANSLNALYTRPEKPPRTKSSLKNRKSWDLPGSIENLCNSAMSDNRSVKSFTASICDSDSYACVDDLEGATMASDYMDMNPILDDTNMTILDDVNEQSRADDLPLYSEITR